MKQIDECLTRAFKKNKPLRKKWQAAINGNHLILVHYHHLVMVYDIETHTYLHEWWEKPADKRGLDSAKAWLEDRRRKLTNPS